MGDNVHVGHRNRVRDRFLKEGIDSFEDHQVLEFLLFGSYPQQDTNIIAHKMINEFGSLAKLLEAHPRDISERCGVTLRVAVSISLTIAVGRRYRISKLGKSVQIKNSKMAAAYAEAMFFGVTLERFYMICLDSQRYVIHTQQISEGSVGEAPVSMRKITETALMFKAAAVILMHNHPGGTLVASKDDREVTKIIVRHLRELSVEVVDHIIVCGEKYVSFAESGLGDFAY